MPTVRFTRHLQRYFQTLDTVRVQGTSVAQVVTALDALHPGIRDYVTDERGRLRQHVNIFIGNEMVTDRVALSDVVAEDDELYIMQALSGG